MEKIFFQKPDISDLRGQGYTLVDMHVHSNYSRDGVTRVHEIISKARQMGIGVAVTDHNRIEGAVQAVREAGDVLIIPGIEMRSTEGIDMLIYFQDASSAVNFYSKIVLPNKRRDLNGSSKLPVGQILDIAEHRGCLVAIAHPYRFFMKKPYAVLRGKRTKKLLCMFHAVEVINGKNLNSKNRKAIETIAGHNTCIIGGSDAHRFRDIGIVLTGVTGAADPGGFLDGVRSGRSIVVGKETTMKTKISYPISAVRNAMRFSIHK